jgi:hypothetical protein
VVTTLACFTYYLHARLRVHRASGIPCALFIWVREKLQQSSGAWRRENEETRRYSSPLPPARIFARGGEGSGVGGASADSLAV